MITVRYRVVHDCATPIDEVSADDLDYRCFLGDVSLSAGPESIDASWGWVPLVHFATMMLLALDDLLLGETQAEIQFTENDGVIILHRDGRDVYISATFSSAIGSVPLEELRDAVVLFATTLFDDLIERHPALIGNTILNERLQVIVRVRSRRVADG